MNENHLWIRAQKVQIQTSVDIVGGFDYGFDTKVPEDTRAALRHFMRWVEDHYRLPVTLWVDFKYNHYLKRRNGEQAGYLFYWHDFTDYPLFDNPDLIPIIHLPVRTEHWELDEILFSFIEGISDYYDWLMNSDMETVEPISEEDVVAVLQAYLQDSENEYSCAD